MDGGLQLLVLHSLPTLSHSLLLVILKRRGGTGINLAKQIRMKTFVYTLVARKKMRIGNYERFSEMMVTLGEMQ